MRQYNGIKIGTGHSGESVIVYGAGQTVGIDRTTRAQTWCKSHGMTPAYTVTAGPETFTVWTGIIRTVIGGEMDAACAIPA